MTNTVESTYKQLVGNGIFLDYPQNVLGVIQEKVRGDRDGKIEEIVVGDIDTALMLIPAPAAPHWAQALESAPPTSLEDSKGEIPSPVRAPRDQAVAQHNANRIKARKNILKQEVMGISECHALYNGHLSQEEVDAFLTVYPQHPLNSVHKIKHSEKELIDKGLLFYDGSFHLVYRYEFLSGDVSSKLTALRQVATEYIERYGEVRLQYTESTLSDALPVRKRVDSVDENRRIILLPHSEIARTFVITKLKPSLNVKFLREGSLQEAYAWWITTLPNKKLEPSTKKLVDKYIWNKTIRLSDDERRHLSEAQEKDVREKRVRDAKEVGDKLFAEFLLQLDNHDIMVLNDQWNLQYNGLAEIQAEKIPVAFQFSKVFKHGAPLKLSNTQRNGVAFAQTVGGNILGYDVGVGKTLAQCAVISNMIEVGRCSRFLMVVPDQTYSKWIREIHGGEGKHGEKLYGSLPHLNLYAWHNLNADLVYREVKSYSGEERKHIEGLKTIRATLYPFTRYSMEGKAQRMELHGAMEGLQKKWLPEEYKAALTKMERFFDGHLDEDDAYIRAKEYCIDLVEALLRDIRNAIYAKGQLLELPPESIVLVNFTGMMRLGFSKAGHNLVRSRIKKILLQGKVDPKDDARITKQIDEAIGYGEKQALLHLDALEIDGFGIDEAHNMKKIFTKVSGRKLGVDEYGSAKYENSRYALDSGTPSQSGIHAFCISQYIQQDRASNPISHLTATPFTNSPLEVYSMLCLSNYFRLEKHGQHSLLEFFNNYIREDIELVINAKGEPKYKAVINGYNNVQQLRSVIYDIIDIKTGEEADITRPNAVIIPDVSPEKKYKGANANLSPTPFQREIFENLQHYLRNELNVFELTPESSLLAGVVQTQIREEYSENLERVFQTMDEDTEPESYRILRSLAFSRQTALSPYLFPFHGRPHPTAIEFVEESPKINYTVQCIASVKEWHEKRKEPVSGMVIYSGIGVNFFPLIKEYLTKELKSPFLESEVAILTGKTTKKRKELIKDGFLNGDIKVLIGSDTIKEGIDLQNNSSVLFELTPDWNPTDYNQLKGRIWRQGNRFANVRIVSVLLEDSAETFIYQKRQEKQNRIKELLDRDGKKSILDTGEVNPEEIKEALITDPEVRADMQILRQSREMDRRLTILYNQYTQLKDFSGQLEGFKKLHARMVTILNAFNIVFSGQLREEAQEEDRQKHLKAEAKGEKHTSTYNPEAEEYKIISHVDQNYDEAYMETMSKRATVMLRRFNSGKTPTDRIRGDMALLTFQDLLKEWRAGMKGYLRGMENMGEDSTEDDVLLAMELKQVAIREVEKEMASLMSRRGEIAAEIAYEINQGIQGERPTLQDKVLDFTRLNYLLEEKTPLRSGEVVRTEEDSKVKKLKLLKLASAKLKLLQLELELRKAA